MTSNQDNRVYAKADQGAFNFTESQAESTLYASSSRADGLTSARSTMDEGDDRASRVSMLTYTSGDMDRFLKKEKGRVFNVLNDTYFLPSDDGEWTRLNKQHIGLVLGMGGLCPEFETIKRVLAPVQGERKRILDLGCGTGVWTLAMAKEFPWAEVVGVDLAPTPVDLETVPSNCHFEVDNIELGLNHFQNQFDVVHARLIGAGLKDFKKSKLDIEMCVKPGGMMIWLDADYDLVGRDPHSYQVIATDETPNGSWMARMIYEMRRGAVGIGKSDVFTMKDVLNRGLWDDPLMDPQTCKAASLPLPLGPWVAHTDINQAQKLKYIGALMRQDFKSVHLAFHPILLKIGFSQELINEWSKNADNELEKSKPPIWCRFMAAWGRRRVAPDEAAPPLPELQATPEDEHEMVTPYSHFYVYNTPEEALAETERRSRSMLNFPPEPPLPPLLSSLYDRSLHS